VPRDDDDDDDERNVVNGGRDAEGATETGIGRAAIGGTEMGAL